MRSIFFCFFALFLSAHARRITFNKHDMPIRMVETSYGQGNHERVTFLTAEIYPRHVNNHDRINFPTWGTLNDYFQEAKEDGDQRGHLVAAQFSGPAEWYNLTPQNARVNRNDGYQCLLNEWYATECDVRRFLDKGGHRHVNWNVRMTYISDSNRPDEYHWTVNFVENDHDVDSAEFNIRNPFLRDDQSNWICRQCRSSIHSPNSGCTRTS